MGEILAMSLWNLLDFKNIGFDRWLMLVQWEYVRVSVCLKKRNYSLTAFDQLGISI